MKIDRLIGILSILLQKEKVTAPQLAKKFEVSRRTINRDIEALCMAGIPVVTSQGNCGGISIMNSYKVSKNLFTSREMQQILAGLRSIDSVSGSSCCKMLMDKLQMGSAAFTSGKDTMLIDLSSWYKDSLAPKIDSLNAAIEQKELVEFVYHSPKGESVRQIEPYFLVFKWSSWYIYGYCFLRNDFRLFKLNRLTDLKSCGTKFVQRQAPLPDFNPGTMWPEQEMLKVVFEPEVKWRLIEEYGTGCYETMSDGRLLFRHGYGNGENLFNWVLTFGEKALILEPAWMKEKMLELGKNLCSIYGRS